ncbi:MAG: TatD family hydrolase [Spirochaetia bacterium]|nr:TatD family hydrolase [Spirochaetia bacterium]
MSSTTHKTEPHFELLPGMIDSHFHSAMMEKKGMDVRPLISQALQAGLAGGIDIGIEAGDTARRQWIQQEFPQIKLAAGLYPAEAEHEEITGRIALLCEDIERFSPAAVGEMGVDRYWNYATVERQQELMRRQIEVANRYRLPIIIHNREADAEVLEVLKDTPPRAGGVLHCFSSHAGAARSFVDAGLYISFAGNLTYKKSSALREAAAAVPLDRLLAETDSPFLSPQKLRGKLNHPGQVGFVYRTLAELHGQELERLIQLISENFGRLFGG